MKKYILISFFTLIGLLIFIIGYNIGKPEYNSCKSFYESLKESDLCFGKLENYVGIDSVIDHIEWFDLNLDDNYGTSNDSLIGPNKKCYQQGYLMAVESEKQDFLIDCFVNSVEIKNGALTIQCGCFYD